MYNYSKRSLINLKQCHQDIQTIFNEVIKEIDCTIVCGHRNEKDQNKAFKNKFSKLKFPKSKHNKKPSLAVDVIPHPSGYYLLQKINELAKIVKRIAKEKKIKIVWGGSWAWKDLPHFELEVK